MPKTSKNVCVWKAIMLCSLLAIPGCGHKDAPAFRSLVEKADNDLRAKTTAHQTAWGMGRAERWDLNQENGQLIFRFSDRVVTCEAQIIGSFDQSRGTWLWSWANPSVLSNLTVASQRLRDYGRQHGYSKLTKAEWKATEEDAWEMAALATLLGDAQGAYRGPAGDVFVFMTFGKPRIEKKTVPTQEASQVPTQAR